MRRLLALILMLTLLSFSGAGVLAQDAEGTPSPDTPTRDRDDDPDADQDEDIDEPDDPDTNGDDSAGQVGDPDADLAAMALDSESMPEGYALSNEYYVDLEGLAESLADQGALDDADEFADLNVTAYYESFYAPEDFSGYLRTYVISYESADDVEAGFELFEDESLFIPDDSGEWEDEPGFEGIGDEPAEITTATIETPDGGEEQTVDVTFTVDRFQVGVSQSTFDGSDPDLDLLEELAEEIEERVTAVAEGDEVENVDTNLPELLPTLAGPPPFEGYGAADDAFGYGGEAADEIADEFVSAYTRAQSFSEDPTLGWQPYLTIAVASFSDDAVVEDLLAEPDVMAPAFEGVEEADVDEVGDSPAVSFVYPSPISTGDPDSFVIFVGVESLILKIEVQGIQTIEQAEEEALGIAEDFLSCVVDGSDCGPYELPSDIGAEPPSPPDINGTPVTEDDEEDEDA